MKNHSNEPSYGI